MLAKEREAKWTSASTRKRFRSHRSRTRFVVRLQSYLRKFLHRRRPPVNLFASNAVYPGYESNKVEMPDRITPIIGWRCWLIPSPPSPLAEQGLYSANRQTIWKPGTEMRAECMNFQLRDALGSPHVSPCDLCTCGFYAVTDPKNVPWNIGDMPGLGDVVVGRVALWGKVCIGERGYRAEFAYPVSFFTSVLWTDHPVLRAFKIPVLGVEEFMRACA